MLKNAAMSDIQALLNELDERGLRSRIARELNITPGAVTQWQEVPAKHVLAVAKITGIPRHRLRPDLYPVEGEVAA